jgi:hypothetical protein
LGAFETMMLNDNVVQPHSAGHDLGRRIISWAMECKCYRCGIRIIVADAGLHAPEARAG